MGAHNSITVKNCLARKGVMEEKSCPICQGEPESILHALRDCPRIVCVDPTRDENVESGLLGEQSTELD